jgi:cytochrome c peroxidase
MLAGRLEGTAPYGWLGDTGSLVAHIRATVTNLGGSGLADEELDALANYVADLRVVSNARADTPLVGRGKAVFDSPNTGCSNCHIASTRFTDGELHVLPAGAPHARTAFDTPSLAFVGRTAPYFHDGRYASLEELVDGCDGIMGWTKHLSPDDRQALVAYLRSL